MEYYSQKPNPLLSNYFEEYFAISVNKKESRPSLIIPDGTHGILFVENASIRRFGLAEETPSNNLKASYVFGQKTLPVYYDLGKSKLFFYGIKVKAAGLKPFINAECSELTNQVIEAKDVSDRTFHELESRLYETPDMYEKFKLIDTYYIGLLKNAPRNNRNIVYRILDSIHKSRGHIRIPELATSFNIGNRTLNRLFNKEVGLSPKAYSRIVRFNASLYNFGRLPGDNLTQLAYSSGYYDQNHFIKEVKAFTNLTPHKFYKAKTENIVNQQRRLFQDRFAGS